jgi:hypothetical protein
MSQQGMPKGRTREEVSELLKNESLMNDPLRSNSMDSDTMEVPNYNELSRSSSTVSFSDYVSAEIAQDEPTLNEIELVYSDSESESEPFQGLNEESAQGLTDSDGESSEIDDDIINNLFGVRSTLFEDPRVSNWLNTKKKDWKFFDTLGIDDETDVEVPALDMDQVMKELESDLNELEKDSRNPFVLDKLQKLNLT